MYGLKSIRYDLIKEKYWFVMYMLFKYFSIIPQIKHSVVNQYSDEVPRSELDKRLIHVTNNRNTSLNIFLNNNNNKIEKTNDIFIKQEE